MLAGDIVPGVGDVPNAVIGTVGGDEVVLGELCTVSVEDATAAHLA